MTSHKVWTAWFFLAAVTAAAGTTSDIKGKVVDAKSTPIPGAVVRLQTQDPGPPLEALTEEDGTFVFANLPDGKYTLVVEMSGFQRFTEELSLPVAPSESSRILVLKRPAAPPPSAASTSRPTQPAGARPPQRSERTFGEVEMLEFPEPELDTARNMGLGNRESAAGGGNQQDSADLLMISGNSAASIDMSSMEDPQFRERIREMVGQMGFGPGQDSGFGGFGRGPGGPGGGGPMGGGMGGFGGFGAGRGPRGAGQARVNGNIFSSYRNSALNARPYSLTGIVVDQPLQIQNNFGASLGGPLPWGARATSQGRRRQFAMQQPGMWFFSYSGSRNRNPYDALTTVPTELERSGDFSQTSLKAGPLAGRPVILYDPFSATPAPFPGNRIPASAMNPAALELMKYIPLPNLPGTVQNYTQQRGLLNSSNSFSLRINSRASAKDNVFFNYSVRTGNSVSSQPFPGLDTTRMNKGMNAAIGGMHRFQPRLMLNYRVTLNRTRTESTNPFAYSQDLAGELGIEGVSREPINFGIPVLDYTNYGDVRLGSPSLNRNQTITIGAGLNKLGGRHVLTFGGDFSWNQVNTRVDTDARGTFTFTGFGTSAFDTQGRPLAGTGYDFADFLLGLPYSTSRRFGSSNNYLRSRRFNLFVQDNWRVRSNLTVSLGLRYEFIQPYYEKYDRIVGLDAAPAFTAVAQVFPGDVGPYSGLFPRSLVRSDKNNFSPRIGIAWKRKPSSRWVFRAGYGLFYNPSVYPAMAGQLVGQPPFAVSQYLLTSTEAPLTLQKGFPENPDVTILNTYAIDPVYRIGYVHQWNLNVQTRLFNLYALEVGYVGSKGTRLDILRSPNRAPSNSSPGNTEENRAIANAGNFLYQSSGANSIMHGLQLRLTRRFSRGVRLEGSYNLSKSIDNASGIGGGALVVVQDDHNIAAERALSGFDQRHRLQANFSLDLPFGQRRRFLAGVGPLAGNLVSGWSLNGSLQLNSGTPLTARILGNIANNSGTGSYASERPDASGLGVSLPGSERSTLHYFNTSAFIIPPPGAFGNAGRNTIPGPGTSLLNLTLRKSFRLDDNNRRIDFQWQVTNALNHPNFAGLGTTVNALNFGRVTGVRSMRQMEFQLRISF